MSEKQEQSPPITDEQFVQAIAEFSADLLSKQRPLDPEFEKILHDNLIDLYA